MKMVPPGPPIWPGHLVVAAAIVRLLLHGHRCEWLLDSCSVDCLVGLCIDPGLLCALRPRVQRGAIRARSFGQWNLARSNLQKLHVDSNPV